MFSAHKKMESYELISLNDPVILVPKTGCGGIHGTTINYVKLAGKTWLSQANKF